MIDFRLVPYEARTPEQAKDDPMDRPGAGWKPDMTPEEVWEYNRGYWKLGARARAQRYATFSTGDGRVRCAARITRVVNVGVVPSKGEERYALEGEVLKPGDPEYDRLMSMVIRWHRNFMYIDDASEPDLRIGQHQDGEPRLTRGEPTMPLSEGVEADRSSEDDESQSPTSTLDPQEAVDREGLLASLREIRPETHEGHRAPYQFLVLLWAISRAKRGQPRVTPYLDVKHELADMLLPFRIADSAPNPANPWYALQGSNWWKIFPPIPTNYKEVDDLNTIAGLKQPIYNLVATDPHWAAQAIETITALIEDNPDLQDLIVRLGLSQISAPPPSDALPRLIPVEVHTTEEFAAEYRALPSEYRQRREAKLQDDYEKYLIGMNHKVRRHQIPIDGQYLYTDLYDETTGDLIEAKASSDRVSMRLALDRFSTTPNLSSTVSEPSWYLTRQREELSISFEIIGSGSCGPMELAGSRPRAIRGSTLLASRFAHRQGRQGRGMGTTARSCAACYGQLKSISNG